MLFRSQHEKAIQDVNAALKAIASGGSEGEEHQADEKSADAPKPKVEVRDIRQPVDAFEVFMANRRVLRTVDSAIGKALEDLNRNFKENFAARR